MNFREELLLRLDDEYDEVTYDISSNVLIVKVYKSNLFTDLSDLMKALEEEIWYPFQSFHSDNDSYTFTYNLMVKQ